jgi:DNA-binding CsgD family transcriptional regulator
MLESLGLTSAAAEVYNTILQNQQFGVADIIRCTGMPDEQVRNALDELARLSLVRQSWEDPQRLLVVSPIVGFASLLAEQERELAHRQEELSTTRSKVVELINNYAFHYRSPGLNVEHLIGIDEIRSRIEELASACQHEVMAFAPRGVQSPEALDASRPLDEGVLARGVLMRTLYVQGIYNNPISLGYAQWLVEQGGHVRTAPSLSLRLIIYDRQLVLAPVNPEDEKAGAVLMRGTGVVDALCEHFEQVWERAALLNVQRPRGKQDELTDQQRAVLRLLGEGHTDEVIARRLGVSVRTARRITAEIMTLLDARSRFQAGTRAVERGLLRAHLD